MMYLQKQNKTIFIDRDNTIIKDTGYTYKIKDLCFLPNSLNGLRNMRDLGYHLIIITNQSGVGRGLFSKDDYFIINNYLLEKLKDEGIKINDVFQCFHCPEENCQCRKPKTKFKDLARIMVEADFNKQKNRT